MGAPRQELLATRLREPHQEPFQGVLRAPLTGPRMALFLGSFRTSSDPLKASGSPADAFRASRRGSPLAVLALALRGPGWSWSPLLSSMGIVPPAPPACPRGTECRQLQPQGSVLGRDRTKSSVMLSREGPRCHIPSQETQKPQL